VNPDRPTAARLYDYYLGGTHWYPVDKKFGDQLQVDLPEVHDVCWANRAFHQRAAAYLANEAGIRQFIDLGSGLPTMTNTHEVVPTPPSRVIYVDIDPQVEAQGAPLLPPGGCTRVITADLRDPPALLARLDHPDIRALISLSLPVGLLCTAVLHFVSDEEDPWGIVRQYVDALAPGSYVAISQVTGDRKPPRAVEQCRRIFRDAAHQPIYPRTLAGVERFFGGLDLVPPYHGALPQVVHAGVWGAVDPALADSDGSAWMYAGVAKIQG
jgi:hypothetical protein